MTGVVLLLGGNRGEVERTFERAIGFIADRIGPVRAKSRQHWTEPWGFTDDRLFLNQALLVDTDRTPDEVMTACLEIERALGRQRTPATGGERVYEARTIDIDVLMIEDRVIHTDRLHVPHPRMHQRAFALSPAADIVPAWEHPLLHRSVLSLLHDVKQGT